MKMFDFATLISATNGTLMCDMGDLYKLYDYLTGEANWTHHLPAAFDLCKPFILEHHPIFADLELPPFHGEEEAKIVIKGLERLFGPQYPASFALPPFPKGPELDHFFAHRGDLLLNAFGGRA